MRENPLQSRSQRISELRWYIGTSSQNKSPPKRATSGNLMQLEFDGYLAVVDVLVLISGSQRVSNDAKA